MSDPEGDGGMEAVQQEFRDVPETASDETAWLIEFPGQRPTYYGHSAEDGLWFGRDHLAAIRFSRKEDAQAVIDDIGWTEAKPVEHMWSGARIPAPVVGDVAELIERLREVSEGDHERLCQGREYACTCGYDQRTLDAATEAASRLAALQQRMDALERKNVFLGDANMELLDRSKAAEIRAEAAEQRVEELSSDFADRSIKYICEKARAEAAEARERVLREALSAAPRPNGDSSRADPVEYMDWFFQVRLAALSAHKEGGE
jgi:hypothetical protein